MRSQRWLVTCILLLSACSTGNDVLAQGYPARTVRIIAPYPPGGGADNAARIIAQALTESMKQQFIVDNRPGASGQIGTELAVRAPADGYTLLLGNVGPNAILPVSGLKIPYEPINDFAPITLVAQSEYALAVHPSLPVKTVRDLIALAKSRPRQVAFGSTGVAGGPHLAGELLNSMAGIQLLHVAYKGGAPVMTALLSGEVPMSLSSLPTVLPYSADGRLRIVAVTSPQRSPFAKDVPAIAETVPGYAVTQWYGLLAPAKTDAAIVDALHAEVSKAVTREPVKRQFAASGATATSTTPAAFRQLIQSELAKYRKVFASGAIKLD